MDVLARIGRHDGALHLDEGRRGRVLGIALGAPAVVDLGRGGEGGDGPAATDRRAKKKPKVEGKRSVGGAKKAKVQEVVSKVGAEGTQEAEALLERNASICPFRPLIFARAAVRRG